MSKLKFKKILSCFILAAFVFGQVSLASDLPSSCLTPPSYLKPPCGIVAQEDGTYDVKVYGTERSRVEFLWFLMAEAIDKGLEEPELINLISELFENSEDADLLNTFDVEGITKDRGSFLLPIGKGNRAFRFFNETNIALFRGELLNDEKLVLSSGKIIRFSLVGEKISPDATISKQYEEELNNVKNTIRHLREKFSEIWNKPHALKNILSEEYGFHLIKTSGRKLLMYSANKKYILKINWEEDNGYAKEKVFFLRNLPIPGPKMVFYDDDVRALVFNNVTINNDSILFYDYLRNHMAVEDTRSIQDMVKAYAEILANIHSAPRLPAGDKNRLIFRPQDKVSQMARIKERCGYLKKTRL